MIWDIFCRVIDNYGDIGICWRLSADLAARGEQVRLWVDDPSALQWMAPGACQGQWPRVQVLNWSASQQPEQLSALAHSDVWIEGFGCEIASEFVAHWVPRYQARSHGTRSPVWINLEYLSAEAYVERSHLLQSPVMHGPAQGWHKTFFYPGFSSNTGGLLREPDLVPRQNALTAQDRQHFLQQHTPLREREQVISLFCYHPALLLPLLRQLARQEQPTLLLVAYGSTQSMLRQCLCEAGLPDSQGMGALRLVELPALSQPDFDTLLQCCDLNFVRGEDSVIRALWAGKPFVWHIYPQHDGAHGPKLDAFLQRLSLGPAVSTLHRAWNGLANAEKCSAALDYLRSADRQHWQQAVHAARSQMMNLHDLTSALNDFIQKKR